MKKIGLFWGSTSGNTEIAVEFMEEYLKDEGFEVDSHNVAAVFGMARTIPISLPRCWFISLILTPDTTEINNCFCESDELISFSTSKTQPMFSSSFLAGTSMANIYLLLRYYH